MEFTASNVEMAVLDFYRTGSAGQQRNQHDWLANAQLSKEAWQFAWELISPNKNPEVQFFGANTLATKVSKCYQEVPESDFPMLRNRLIALFQAHAAKGPKIVSTRICVAVASLLIHSLPHLWETPVQDLISLLQSEVQQVGLQVLPAFLELLTIVPEEFATLVMTSSRRATVRANLTDSLPLILQIITKIFEDRKSLPTEAVRQGIKCLQSWIQFGVPAEITEGLFDQLLGGVLDEELFDCSLETMSSIISHPNTHSHPHTMKKLVPKLLSLEPVLTKLLNDEAFDVASPLASLFIAFGENHSRLLLDWTAESEEGKQQATRIVSVILQLSSCRAQYPTQETLSEMPFGFWYIFQDDIIACEPQQYQLCVGVFGTAYHTLVEALLKKSMYPLSESDWTSDQKEAFRCYRTDVADTIMYCHNILRDDLLQLLNHHLDQAITKSQQGQTDQHWPYLEACLYSWSAIGESMAEEEENYLLVQFLAKLPAIPYGNNLRVISSALDCIGGFAEWLANYPNLVLHLVPIVTSSISNPELALSATMALKDMARDCTDALQPSAKDILSACCSALRSDRLKNGECVRLMYPIGKMISLSAPKDVLPQLEPILMPYLMDLQNTSAQAQSLQVKQRLLFILKLLTTLFQALELGGGGSNKSNEKAAEAQQQQANSTPRSEPICILMPQIVPLLKAIAGKWISDEEVMEAVWLFTKQSMPSLIESAKPLVAEIVDFISSCFAVQPQSPAIELARHIVLLSNNDAGLKNVLVSLFARISVKTMECLQSSPNPSEYSELVATLFQNMTQILKKNTDYFGPQQQQGVDGSALFGCACFSLSLPESGAVKYASAFLTTFITLSHDNPYLRHVAAGHGEMLFRQTMTCIGSEKSRTFIEHYSDILFSLSKKFFEEFCKWITGFAREDGFPSDKITAHEKEIFAQFLIKERANKRKMTELVQEFALACLGLKT